MPAAPVVRLPTPVFTAAGTEVVACRGVSCEASKSTVGLDVIDERLQLVVARLVQVALRLEHEEARGHAGLELLLLGFEAPFGQDPRRAGGFDALGVGLHLTRELADLRGDLQLLALQLPPRLLVLQPCAGERGLGSWPGRSDSSTCSWRVQVGKSPANIVPSVLP